MSLSLEELEKIEFALRECSHDVEYFSWGPALEFAWARKKAALKLLKREIKELKNVRNK